MHESNNSELRTVHLSENEGLFWNVADKGLVRSGTFIAFLLAIITPPIAATQIETYPPYIYYLFAGSILLTGSAWYTLRQIKSIGLNMQDNKFKDVALMEETIRNLGSENENLRELLKYDKSVEDRLGKEKFDRAEDIFDEKGADVKVGYVPFNPTVVEEDDSTGYCGIGPDFICSIFGPRSDIIGGRFSWANVFEHLIDGKIDVIGTPMYDVPWRREKVQFTMPIFYADIGLYCANQSALPDRREIIDIPKHLFPDGIITPMAFRDAKDALSKKENRLEILGKQGKYDIKVVDNELNSKLIPRHFDDNIVCIQTINDHPFEVKSVIEALVIPGDRFHSDFVFCERAQADKLKVCKDGKVVNLLKEGELLFPVCFAVRKNEDTVRKFMNMRILELESVIPGGIATLIAKSASKTNGLDPKEAQSFFRRRDFPASNLHNGCIDWQ